MSSCSTIYTSLPVLVLAIGAITGGKLILRLEISNLELAYLPSFERTLINLVTLRGVLYGLIESQVSKRRTALSTLFFLTPLVYGSTKSFSLLIEKIKFLDNGWVEPYFIIKNYSIWLGSHFIQEGT